MGLFKKKDGTRTGLGKFFKRTGDALGDAGKFVVNVAASPVNAITRGGKPAIGDRDFSNKRFGEFSHSFSKNVAAPLIGTAAALTGIGAIGAGGLGAAGGIGGALKGGLGLAATGGRKIIGGLTGLVRSKSSSPAKDKKSIFSGIFNKLKSKGVEAAKQIGNNLKTSVIPKVQESLTGGKLPTGKEILEGILKGAGNTVSESEAGKEVKNQIVLDWFKKNLGYLLAGLLSLIFLITQFKRK